MIACLTVAKKMIDCIGTVDRILAEADGGSQSTKRVADGQCPNPMLGLACTLCAGLPDRKKETVSFNVFGKSWGKVRGHGANVFLIG